MKNSRKKIVAVLGLALLLLFVAACAKELNFVDSTTLKTGKVDLIKRGTTTKKQIIKGFGNPESTTPLEGGRESVFYKDLNLRSLWVEFDKDGIVSDFKYSGK